VSLLQRVDALFDDASRHDLVELRRELHRHPELSFEENDTQERLRRALERLEPADLQRVARTGLVARIAGRDRGAPVVAVRGDIDGLPIQEETGLPFASLRAGVMHACGHDVHATWAVGAARLLRAAPAHGDVVVVLQPAEEIGQGAPAVLASGALDDVRAIYGGHVDRRFAVGEVVAEAGPAAAAADAFHVVLRGQGAHGARPQLGRDPVVALAALVAALQTIVSRRLEPGVPAVVTVGTLRAGHADNVIPETAELSGTLRSTDEATRRLLETELRHLASTIAAAHGVEAAVTIRNGTPAMSNTTRESEWARAAAASLLGDGALLPRGPINMGGEDFAFYLERIPGAFLRIGAREPGGEAIGAHNPRFYAAEESIFVGAAVLAEAARRASAALE
jgi:hippurate hydrolase